MENEYQILSHLQENEKTSQRKISQNTGLSLGAVNILIKKMVRKGLIKVEKLNSRTIRYILTPQGMHEKARLTYQYVSSSYRQIMKISRTVETLISSKQFNGEKEEVILFGPPDEVEQVLKMTLNNLNIKAKVIRPEQNGLEHLDKQLILIWREEEENICKNKSGIYNIMKLV